MCQVILIFIEIYFQKKRDDLSRPSLYQSAFYQLNTPNYGAQTGSESEAPFLVNLYRTGGSLDRSRA